MRVSFKPRLKYPTVGDCLIEVDVNILSRFPGYEVLSTGPTMLLQFTANSATPGQGFAATFHFQPPPDSTAAGTSDYKKPLLTHEESKRL